MLVHLGALGRHLGANMSQHTPKMRSKMRSWSQHGSKQCPRRLNKPLQPPRITKNLKQPKVFNDFCYPTHVRKCSQIDAKSTQNRPPNLQVEPQVAILAPTWANLGRSCSNLLLPYPVLGVPRRQFPEKSEAKFRQRRPKPPKDPPNLDFARFWVGF